MLNVATKKVIFLISILFIVTSLCASAEENTEEETDLLLNDLFLELEKVTAIATHTKLNVDYVPGMVTVLHGSDLQKQGIHTLTEALQTVPGVEITLSDEGQSNYVMRGIGKSFSSGKIKMLINGRAMNAAMSAASTISVVPLQLIERIEVIRGPGSAIYGEYAYAGVVNIIMRKESQVFYTGSHHNKHTVGGSWSNYQTEDAIKYLFNFSAHDNEGKQVFIESDYLREYTSRTAVDPLFNNVSNTPGYSNEAERIFSSALQVSYKNFQWDTFFAHQKVGDFFGYQNALPPEVVPIRKVITLSSDLDKKFKISDQLSGTISAGGRYYAVRGDLHFFLPKNFPDFSQINTTTGAPTNYFTDGVLGSPNYTEREVHSNLEFNYSGIVDHDVLFGIHAAYIRQGDTWARRNHEFQTVPVYGSVIAEVPLLNYRGSENWLTENNSRKIASVYVQDQWNILKPLTLTLGGRYDSYFENGSSFNPRLAAVYNFLDNHIFKIQAARAFRPPTFIEMYIRNNIVAEGNENIKPEIIQSVEAGYIYNRGATGTVFRSTVFYSQMNDLISINETNRKYENLDSVISQGLEVEITQKFFKFLTFNANATKLDVKDKATDIKLPNIATLYGYANVTYQPVERMMVVLSDQYIGSRKREQGDPRGKLPGNHSFNFTFSLNDALIKNACLNVGIKNILDTSIKHPSPMVNFAGMELPSYINDYPRPGREFWLNLAYKI